MALINISVGMMLILWSFHGMLMFNILKLVLI